MEKWSRAKYQPNLNLGKNEKKLTACTEHIFLTREAAAEGMVLLKNQKNLLPIKKGTKVALFGKATFDYVQGGGGSGEVNVAYSHNLFDGFIKKADRVSLYEPLADFYSTEVKRQYADGAVPGMTIEPLVPPELLQSASKFADVAIISICRFSGEGWDRKAVPSTSPDQCLWENIDTPAVLAAKLFEDGDFCLTHAEKEMIYAVEDNFQNVVVVINAGGVMDSSWFCHSDKIQAVLMAWAGGMEGGLAAADILVGDVNPSGKLADTMAISLEDYPSTDTFHLSEEYVEYQEDIYVGYRYFESFPAAITRVNYPFGFGLSYTKFEIDPCGLTVDGDDIVFDVSVTNTGQYPGKEVVQVYFSAPQGVLGKPARQLSAFAKTILLTPNESQNIKLRFPIAAMASFDDMGRIHKSNYILEPGEYRFYVGNSVRDAALLPQTYSCEKIHIIEELTEKLTPYRLQRRLLADGSYETLPVNETLRAPTNFLEPMSYEAMEGYTPIVKARPRHLFMHPYKKNAITLYDVANGKTDISNFIEQLTDEEMADLLGGQHNTGVGITFGFGNLPEYGVPNIMTADGPAGLRVAEETGVYTTAWPCATLLACTWNELLLEQVGVAGSCEVKENNLSVWLTPAVNIHRSPLCGRNFEYYSEDPLLAGKMASAMIRGIQSQNIAACIKHFAFNNKETNRKHSDSRLSERAAREIYLKPFEIAVKEANPWVVMSSYNIVNGVRCAECHELLEGILRGEWGFSGLVTTDWWAHSEEYLEIKAGNDVKMGCGYPDRVIKAVQNGELTREEMKRSVRRVLELILKID